MNTKGIKFLAVLAVLAMAFAACAVLVNAQQSDADEEGTAVLDGITFDFKSNVAYGDPYGTLTTANVQNLTVVKDVETRTITLSGDLFTIVDPSAEATVIKAMYGDELPSAYGIAFALSGMKEGAKVSLNAAETTTTGGKDSLYQPLTAERTSSMATTFTVTIKDDGIHSKIYTIDFSQLMKAQVDSKKFFTVQAAIDNAGTTDGKTVKVLNDTTPKAAIVINKLITIDGGANDKKTITGTIKYDEAALVTATASAKGAVTVQNLKIVTSHILGANTGSNGGSLNLSLIWNNCDIEMNAYEEWGATLIHPTLATSVKVANVEINGCNFVNKYASEAGGSFAIYVETTATDGTPVMKVNSCTFTGYARCMMMNKPGTIEIKNNEIKSGIKDTNGFRYFVQFATTTSGGYEASNISIDMSGNVVASGLTKISTNPVKYVNFRGGVTGGDPNETYNIKSAVIDGDVFLENGAIVNVAKEKTFTMAGLTTEYNAAGNGVLNNAGIVTITSGLDNQGTITNYIVGDLGTINLAGDYDNKNKTTTLVNQIDDTHKATIICGSATLYQLLKNDTIGGILEVAGSSPSEDPVVPKEKAVDAQGKIESTDPVVIATGTVKQAAAIADQSIVITTLGADAVLDVSSSGSEIALVGINMGDNTATVKTVTSTITVSKLKGNITFSSGSIIAVVAPWEGGDIVLKNGDVLKLSGEITGNVGIDFTGTGSATVIIEKGDAKKLTIDGGKTLTIKNANINVEVEGTIDGTGTLDMNKGGELSVDGTVNAAVTGKAKITIDGETNGAITTEKTVVVNGTANGLISTSKAAGTVTINGKATAGVDTYATINVYGELSGVVTFHDDAELIAYPASDINGATTADYTKFSGKDASGGTWTLTDAGLTLNLTGYTGVFNFEQMKATITSIILSGDSEVTYALPETSVLYELFPAVQTIKTVQGSGSLDIELDISKADETAVSSAQGIFVFSDVEKLTLSSVEVGVTVKGTNAAWDLKDTAVYGIKTGDVKMNSSILGVDVISALTAKKTLGIECAALSLSSSSILVKSAGTGIKAEKNVADYVAELNDGSSILSTGKVLGMEISNLNAANKALDLSATSLITVNNGFVVDGNIDLAQNSVLAAEKLTLESGTIKNNATMVLSDLTVIKKGAEIDNLATLNNSGTINVFGKLEQKAGTFTNEGTVTVFAKEYQWAADKTVTFTAGDATKIGATSAVVTTITINDKEDVEPANGILKITKATVSFTYKAGSGVTDADFKNLDGFTGTLAPVQSANGKNYTLTLTNGTANIMLTYDPTKDAGLGSSKQYVLTVSGTIAKNVGTDKFSVAMPSDISAPTNIDDLIKNVTEENTSLKVTGGKMDNKSVVAYYGIDAQANFLKADAEWEGPAIIGAQTVTINGKFTGDLTSKGAVIVDNGTFKGKIDAAGNITVGNGDEDTNKGKVEGEIISKKAVAIGAKASVEGPVKAGTTLTSKGTIKGTVTAKGNVEVKNLDGDIVVDKNGDYTVTIKGKAVGTLTFNSAAKEKVPGEGETVEPTTFPVVMAIDADLDATTAAALTIHLNKAVDATESEPVKKGYLSIGSADVSDLSDGKNVNLTMKVGKFTFYENMTVPVRYAIVFEADTIAEVASIATVDFSNSALKVSKDATCNFVTGTTPVTEFGLVKAIMSFTIESGAYTIYSGVTYALANCEENSELTVELDAKLTDNVEVKAGVNVIVSDKVTLDFDKYGIDMNEGAKITLVGTGKVIFKKTEQNLYPGDDTKDYDYYTVNGTIVFDDNSITLDSVRFCGDGTSTIKGVAATSTAASKLDIDVTYNQGIISTATGMASGKVVLENCKYYATKADAEAGKYTKEFAMLKIADETVFDATSITDMAMDAELDASKNIEILMLPTIVTVNGVLNLNGNTTVNGLYNGEGTILLAKNKEIVVPQSTRLVRDAATEDYYYFGGYFNGTVTNALIGGDVITIEGLMANIAAGDKVSLTAYEGSSEAYFKLKGQMLSGETSSEEIVLDGLTIADNATVVADDVKIINASVVTGKLCAKEIDTDSLKKLTYDTTYEALGYTVYTVFENIDWEVITDVTLAASKKLSDFGIEEGKKLDLSGKDVNITIAEGKTLTLDRPLIIGTPIDDLGDEGSSISGKIVIGLYEAGVSYKNAYLIAYSDVDLTEAEIYGYDGKTAAVYSVLDIEDIPYAIIFANENGLLDVGGGETKQAGQVLATVDKSIVPEIEGYIFTKWYNYDETEGSFVGQTNAYAGAKAVTVFVTVKFVTGITYYCNGIEFAIYDTPVKVDYNSVFTAKISDTSKYQGTPLVNGKNSLVITDDVEIVGSGVEPIPEPPQPEPVIGDSGISLTDILLIVLVVLIAIMVVILVLRLNRS